MVPQRANPFLLMGKLRMHKVVYVTAMIGITLIVSAIFLGFGLDTLVIDGSPDAFQPLSVGGAPPRDGILLYGDIQEWDTDSKMLSLFWIPYICGVSFVGGDGACQDLGFLKKDVSFFLNADGIAKDGSANLDMSTALLNYSSAYYNATNLLNGPQNYDIKQVITTDLYNIWSSQTNSHGFESEIVYPFDWYGLSFIMTAVETNTNNTIPMAGASIFNPRSSQWVSNSDYTFLDLPDQAGRITTYIYLNRHSAVIVGVLLLIIFNWLVTLSLLYMSILNVLPHREVSGSDGIALLFAGLFALPTIRGIFPGSPALGCLVDFVGLVPNLCIISGCAVTVLLVQLSHTKPEFQFSTPPASPP
ncbi:hypothetical protein BT96DRAFT_979278 [Gymnopus androsaceus JB14]|uniref:Uncharacterized protein n=1 Tax=Gymnopus androsaceus JB14 TaxID=1447944 RepID=A0A6A4H6C8_9AGAR|nr:hypothetical protein BT96DRAFT_979278 [Gymnopus androsaceus JB14]